MTTTGRNGSAVHETVQRIAHTVASALHNGGGNPFDLSASLITHADDPVALAAARVLGADVLAPWAFLGMPVSQGDLALAGGAARAFPPDTSSVPSTWTHWGLTAALHRAGPGGAPAAVAAAEPEVAWAVDGSWQQITHRFAQLASLAGPTATALLPAAAARADDLSRGFVRAMRRQDWVQAAAVGRWLAAAGCAPASLGLAAGLALVAQVGAGDARAALHVRAAQALARGER
ncbi:hypothetical protein [Streptomyces pinistramenti]|uniref:hypothetical protein n=1 Tax=Streptomyces pinistramenti TaxID=2884812 RepID=UPI001D07B03A|nr:hypothetical protein [Streptomyces pinistramenti]MCB5907809.1 hypothetical protein [Streptomyces pinistramenti]